ncbi:MAG: bifunctional precorrin-2 dehydrogenase/sirohydrochlorin ferrochelatase, partial [Syntrophaceae bacterium]|nr:bifunctional precorrin-2 dehydrogenase/sirohydrochlorin ferrochelatase [Syntrophaceae bacterium]
LGIPVNIVDDPQKCDFILPSIVERGDLTIACSTGGSSPALARRLREELEAAYGEEYGTLLKLLGQLREKMEKNAGVGKLWFDQLMTQGLMEAIRQKDDNKVKKIIHDVTGEEVHID